MLATNKEKVLFFAKASLSSVICEDDVKQMKAADMTETTLEQQKDLMKMVSIMLSTGINKNDDVFLKEEVLPSRSTGAHKPLNDEHDEGKIIGHILRTYVTLKDGTKIPDDVIPDTSDFDITAESVIYKYQLPAIAENIRMKAQAGELFVSVEAWFTDYDYLLGSKVIKRTEETAGLLDSSLRIKGGTGMYKGQKIARILRNILIGGLGVVKNPANPESVIKSVSKIEVNDVVIIDEVINANVIGEIKMSKVIAKEDKTAPVVEQKPVAVTEVKVEAKVETNAGAIEVTKEAAPAVTNAATADVAPTTPVSVVAPVAALEAQKVELKTPEEVTAMIEQATKEINARLSAKDNEAKTVKATYEAAIDIQSAAAKKVNEDLQIKLDAANKEIETLKAEVIKLNASLKAINDKAEAEQLQASINARKLIIETELGLKGEILEKYWVDTATKSQEEFVKFIASIKEVMTYKDVAAKDNAEIKTEASVKIEEKTEVPSVEEMKKIDTSIPIVTEIPKVKSQEEVGKEILSKFFKNKKTFNKSK